jgi:hypothetical protein
MEFEPQTSRTVNKEAIFFTTTLNTFPERQKEITVDSLSFEIQTGNFRRTKHEYQLLYH